MSSSQHKRTLLGYDIDLGAFFAVVKARRRLFFSVVAASVLAALLYLHLATYKYTATLMVSPVPQSSQGGGLAGKLGGLSNLASLAGINIGADAASQAFMLYQKGLYSRDVADLLARDPQIMHAVFHKQWDADTKQWIPPDPIRRAIIVFAQDVIGIPHRDWQPPDGALLQEYITDNVSVDAEPDKPVVTITYSDQDPEFAVKFLHALDRGVDNKLRDLALVRSNQYIGYLSDQLTKVTNSDVRDALMSTLTDQENTVMMASVTAPYSAQPFGPPSASRKQMIPKPFLVLGAALIIGGFFASLAVIWLPPLRWSKTRFAKWFGKPSPYTGR
jgi:uncharacterized protein involved in exopolysaccharide biosynthesis